MGKGKKKFDKKWNQYGKSKKKKKHKRELYSSRAELLLSGYPDVVLDLWFGDNKEEREKFGLWLVDQESYYSDDALDILNDTSEDDEKYDKKIRKIRAYECEDMEDMIMNLWEIGQIEKKRKKGKKLKSKLRNKDLGIATYMDSSRYRKSYLNNDEYRKSLKKIAKAERHEFKEMQRLGYVHRNDPDDELKKLMNANQRITEALSDSYIQKHYLT